MFHFKFEKFITSQSPAKLTVEGCGYIDIQTKGKKMGQKII